MLAFRVGLYYLPCVLLYSLSQDINKNRSIAAALAYEEKFFCDNPVILTFLLTKLTIDKIMVMVSWYLASFLWPIMLKVYSSLSDHCGIPQLARKLNQVGMHPTS